MAYSCLIISASVLAAALFFSLSFKVSKKTDSGISLGIMLVGTAVAAFCLFLPIYSDYFRGSPVRGYLTAAISIHNTLRLFVLDGEFDIIRDYSAQLEKPLTVWYPVLASVLYVVAPLLTFTAVLSLFKGIRAFLKYRFNFSTEVYIFSELNERMLNLAGSIRENHKKALIVFTGVGKDQDSENTLKSSAQELGAVIFSSDLRSALLKSKKEARMYFFVDGDNEEKKIDQAIYIRQNFGDHENVTVYLFSSSAESELAVNAIMDARVHVHRINEVHTVVNNLLYSEGHRIFENAVLQENGERLISAVIVGVDEYGMEMLKALPWICQMYGYRIVIHVFDPDPWAESKFAALCPELADPALNGQEIIGEAFYTIRFHTGFPVSSDVFLKELSDIGTITYAFVSLDGMEENLRTAASMRMIFEQMHVKPIIKAVAAGMADVNLISGSCNFKGQPYEIEFTGDIRSLYTEQVIVNSELEKEALKAHKRWGGKEEEFWKYSYNYNSSIATVIHGKLREHFHMPGAGKTKEELTEEELYQVELLEHKRWNAYTRSVGYRYSGSKDKASRNDLGKLHNNLVPYEQLTEAEKRLDSKVAAK